MSGDELGKELIRAAKAGDISTVRNIVGKGQICKNKDRSAALVQACKHGFFECVKFLVGALADLTYIDRDGWSPLLGSCCEGHTEIAMYLLEKENISVEEQYKFGKTALHWAAHWGRMELVLKLLDKGAVLDKRDEDGRTPIMCAVFQDQTAVGQFLIQTGADLSLTEYKNGWTVLHGAARYGRQDMVTYLLEAGCDANARDSKGWTALVYACEHGHTEAVLALMSAGADSNVQTNEGFTALHYTRRADIAGMLLEVGANPNIKNRDGNTALHCAAKDGFVEVVRKMIDFGADKNIANQKGKTAAQLTTYDKVREVLSGHVAGSHSPHPPTQSAYVPRFARGTANVAATTATFTQPYKPKQQLGTHAEHNASMASMSGGSHSPVPGAATTPKAAAAAPSVVQPVAPAQVTPTAAPVTPAKPVATPAVPVVKPVAAPAAASAPVVAAPAAAPVAKPAPVVVQPVAAPSPAAAPAPAPTPAHVPVVAPHPTPAPAPVADNLTLMKEALKGGTKEWRRSKLSVVGEGRAGKTALTNAIVGRGFQETSSTVGINQLTCDVKQMKASAHGAAEAEWGVASKVGRELETALAQIVAQHKRRHALGHSSAKASSCMDIRTFLKEQDEGKSRRVDKDALQAHLFKTAAAPAVVMSALQAPKAASAVQSGGAWAPKSHASSAAATAVAHSATPAVAGAWTPKKKTEYLEFDLSSIGTPVKVSTSEPDMSILGQGMRTFHHDSDPVSHRAYSSHHEEPVPVLSEKPDEEMVMKMLATMKDEDTDLLISLFDFGGQSVFDVIHHLFLTRNGVYALVFNMEWLVKDGPEKDKALRFMRNWLSSVAVHTYDKTTNSTAPIVFVGTRLDIVTSPAKHAAISTLLYEQFSDNIAWRSVLENENGHDANGKAFQWFFAVDNKQGKKGPTLKNLMAVVQNAMEGAAYTHKDVPLSWFKVMDQLADAKKDCLFLADVTAIAARCQVSDSEVPYLLAFLHDMGHLMWIDEPGLRDVVVLDPVSYLVTPATVIICKITPDKDDPTHHFMAAHRECERMHKKEWTLLKHDGVLHVSLLPILWKDYLSHKDVLLQLMVKFGLLVPLRTVSNVKNAAQHDTPAISQYLVPTLLSAAPSGDKNIMHWTDAPFSSCYFVFTLSEDLSHNTTINAYDLRSTGFLPGGMFERIVGKALSWSQDTAKGSGVNLQSVLLYKDMAVLTFGGQRFRLVNCADIHCVRVDIEGSNPLGIQQKLQDFVGKIIEECMKSLRCFPAVLYSSSARDQEDLKEHGDPLRKQLLSSELLIPLQQLRAACKGESMLAWRGGRELMTIAQIKSTYDQWLQLYELRERYDVFISYRWGQYDSDLTEALFDMFTNFVVGTDKRAVEVFLDRKRLQDGRRFKVDLAAGLTHSLIALPVVSIDALKRMLEHTTETIDNVLLEWIIILECIAAKRILKVFPVLFGARVTDLRVGGVKVLDFFLDRSKDMLPKIVPTATLEQCRDLLLANGIQPSPRFRTYTVHSVVEEFLQFLLLKASDFDGGRLVEVITDRVMNLLTDCGPEALQLVAGNKASVVPAAAAPAAAPAVAHVAAAPALVAAAAPVAAASATTGVLRKLEDLSVAEVCALMERTAGLKKLTEVFLAKEVSGAMLSYCEEIAELQAEEYGVSNAALARGLLKNIKDWRDKGVLC